MIEAPMFVTMDKLALRIDVMDGNLAVKIKFSNKNNNSVTSIHNSKQIIIF